MSSQQVRAAYERRSWCQDICAGLRVWASKGFVRVVLVRRGLPKARCIQGKRLKLPGSASHQIWTTRMSFQLGSDSVQADFSSSPKDWQPWLNSLPDRRERAPNDEALRLTRLFGPSEATRSAAPRPLHTATLFQECLILGGFGVGILTRLT